MRPAILIFISSLAACSGPDAPDSAVCRDFIHLICIAPVCGQVAPLFNAADGCETTLKKNSGCEADDFAFSEPTRSRFLSCRNGLLKVDGNSQTHPDCDSVTATFEHCPDVVRMLRGLK